MVVVVVCGRACVVLLRAPCQYHSLMPLQLVLSALNLTRATGSSWRLITDCEEKMKNKLLAFAFTLYPNTPHHLKELTLLLMALLGVVLLLLVLTTGPAARLPWRGAVAGRSSASAQ